MNIILFVHGKASAGKDSFVQALKYFCKFQTPDRDKMYLDKPLFTTELQKLFSGKPSAYDNARIYPVSFNEGVYEEACRLNPNIDLSKLKSDYAYKSQYRELLVSIGDGYRKENPYIWIESHERDLGNILQKIDNSFIVTPCLRYENELQYSKSLNKKFQNLLSFSIKIEASLTTRLNRMSSIGVNKYLKFAMQNESETGLDHVPDRMFDCIISNNKNYSEEDRNVVATGASKEQMIAGVFLPEIKNFWNILEKFKK